MGWLNFGGKKRKEPQGFGNSPKRKGRKKSRSHVLERIVTPSAGIGGWLDDFNPLHQLLGSLSLSDLHLPNFLADSGVCPIAPDAPTNNLPPLIDFDPLGLYHDGIATQTPYNPGGAFETLPIAVIPIDPHSPNPSNPNAIRQLLNFPLASQPLVGSIDTGVSADSPYLNYANIKNGRDYVDGDDNPLLKPGEGSEHGTFMLGIVDAINKTAPKWVGRAIDSGRWADSLVEFVDAARASGQKNAIANLSLDLTQKNADGSVTTRYELTPQERSAIEYARQNGVMLVAAAGNDGGVMSVLGQASQEFDNIFTVGAGDINGRSIYSSYGRGLDILADGGTTEHPGLSTVGDDLGTMAGTSVATAKVAGAASLVWAANPALNYRQVMEILKSTARDLGPVGWDDETGFGFLNTLAAVDLAKKTTPEVYKPTAFFQPTTWGGEGLVTPTERAVNIINENFTAWVVSSNGITLRNSPNTSDRSNFAVRTGDTLSFDGWTYGEQLNDLTTGKPDALWYRFRYNGGTYWIPSAWTGGYPGSKPPLLPPTQQPPEKPPVQGNAETVYLSTSSGQILQVNTATGAQNPIYQGRAFTDLAVAPNGKLYGCTFYDGLYEINPSTGAERYVGPLAGGTLNSLTFSPDGRLYGADQGNGNLFQISPDNGQMNLIGNLGGPSSGDLLFNGTNEIFAAVSSPNTSLNDRLVAVNLATGNSRYIGDLGLLEVYGLSWENGQLTAYTSDRRKLAIDPNTAKATVVGTVSSNGLIWGAATKPATASSPTDDVRQKFLYAASLYPQVGAAITGMQDQGGGVFRQEFERAIMIWNGQQVTVYETKGRSVSPTSPSPTPKTVGNNGAPLLQTVNAQYFLDRPQFYTTGNPFFPYNAPVSVGGTGGLPANCTWYASGRVKELGGRVDALSSMTGNAGTWGDNLSRGAWMPYEPLVGDIAEWVGDGHVAVVEKVNYNSDGSILDIVISESNYAGSLHHIRTIRPGQSGADATGWPDRFIRVPKTGQITLEDSFNPDIGGYDNGKLPQPDTKYWRFDKAVTYMYKEMVNNIQSPEAKNIKLEIEEGTAGYLLAIVDWYKQVNDGQEWDHKRKDKLPKQLELGTKYQDFNFQFPGDEQYEYYYDIWSNIHYGYVGAAVGFSSATLQTGSGLNDWVKGTINWQDVEAIDLGIYLWKVYKNQLTEEDFRREILQNKWKLNRTKLNNR